MSAAGSQPSQSPEVPARRLSSALRSPMIVSGAATLDLIGATGAASGRGGAAPITWRHLTAPRPFIATERPGRGSSRMSTPDPESQLPNEEPQVVHRQHRGALAWMPWWVPMWVPLVTIFGVLAIAAIMSLVLADPFEL